MSTHDESMEETTVFEADIAMRIPTTSELRALSTFEEALAYADTISGGIIDSKSLGDGFELVDKSTLVGMPMVLITWTMQTGDMGGYVVVRAMTETDAKVIFVDGSTGIYRQLAEVEDGRTLGIFTPNGLRVSTYPYTDEEGHTVQASTYYIA